MNRSLLIIGASLALAARSVAFDFTEVARAQFSLFVPTGVGFSNEIGYGGAVGLLTGANLSHEFSLEVSSTQWKGSRASGLGYTSKETHMPVLAGYRFYTGREDSVARFFGGASVGMDKAEYTYSWPSKYSASDWVNVAGGTAGVQFGIGDLIAIQTGYQYLYLAEADVSANGLHGKVENAKAHVFFVSASTRF
jgi:hypothetical protein